MKKQTRALLEQKCSELELSVVDQNRITKESAEQQAKTGIAGSENLKAFAAIRYFEFFERKVRAAHEASLSVIESCHTWEKLSEIPLFVDAKIQIFLTLIDRKIRGLTGDAPFSAEVRNLAALYIRLKKDFDFKAAILIRKKRQDFWLKALLIPAVLGLLWILLRRS